LIYEGRCGELRNPRAFQNRRPTLNFPTTGFLLLPLARNDGYIERSGISNISKAPIAGFVGAL
jgi:hypothetical protein